MKLTEETKYFSTTYVFGTLSTADLKGRFLEPNSLTLEYASDFWSTDLEDCGGRSTASLLNVGVPGGGK